LMLVLTEPYFITSRLALLLLPAGIYILCVILPQKPGTAILWMMPLLLLNSFQLVLLYLFGESVISVDMFTALVTSNHSEAGELLTNIWPPIIGTSILYLPIILGAVRSANRKPLPAGFRKKAMMAGILMTMSGLGCAGISKIRNPEYSVKHHVYPVNALYNLQYAIQKWYAGKQYQVSSAGFSFHALKMRHAGEREIYLLVIGEASRAGNWSLFGYERETNPLLQQTKSLVLFPDVLSESNTTHKSVPLLLSAADPYQPGLVYVQKSIVTAFKEAGFYTLFLSNQAPNHSFTEDFAREADQNLNFVETIEGKGGKNHLPDDIMLPAVQEAIENTEKDLLIVMHTYGSHFEYRSRYSKRFAKFSPDSTAGMRKREHKILLNAYDNSILQTDYLLKSLSEMIERAGMTGAWMYVSDHGEDLLDDHRQRFLHSSPKPTYYQLHVPMIVWHTDSYQNQFPDKIREVLKNREQPMSTSVVFHSLLDMASISSPVFNPELSVYASEFIPRKRKYLNDHDQGIDFMEAGLKPEDIKMLIKHQIDFEEIPKIHKYP